MLTNLTYISNMVSFEKIQSTQRKEKEKIRNNNYDEYILCENDDDDNGYIFYDNEEIAQKIQKSFFSKSMLESTCTICLGILENNRIVLLPCGHSTFHKECISLYLSKSRICCPICRHNIDTCNEIHM
jgi:hypothetical protein